MAESSSLSPRSLCSRGHHCRDRHWWRRPPRLALVQTPTVGTDWRGHARGHKTLPRATSP
eukprot:6652015-Pyramimonas_sp.AAC.1